MAMQRRAQARARKRQDQVLPDPVSPQAVQPCSRSRVRWLPSQSPRADVNPAKLLEAARGP